MSKFDVYAIGNALVDSEFVVEDSFFSDFSHEKSLMTLIDSKRKIELWEKANKEPVKKACGGSAANTVIAVSQLGGKSYYAFKVSDDENGSFYCNDMEKNRVEFSKVESENNQPTGTCTVFVTPDAERTMYTHLGATTDFSKNELNEAALKNSKYLYIEGYLVTSPQAIEAIETSKKTARENGVKIALTLSDPGIVAGFKDKFLNIVDQKIDLIFCNKDEAIGLTGADNIHSALEELKKYAEAICITNGAKDTVCFTGKEKILVPSFECTPKNTNGAGDMFAGACLYGLTNGLDFKQSVTLGNFTASQVVQVFGPRFETEDMTKYKKEFEGKYL